MAGDGKTIIIGLDGVPFGMLKNFAETGVMPNTGGLISEGVFKKMQSSIPEISSVAWSSMITGENPGRHGIFGFMDLYDGSYKMRFPNFNDLKVSPFWEQWQGKSIIFNVPSTYPVREMDGVHISGFVSIDFEKSVYPKALVSQLQKMDYRLDVDSQMAHSSMALFLSDLDKTLEARIRAYRYLWERGDWQTFMLVFTGTDRLMHFLFDAYEDKDHKYHDIFLEHFNKIDRIIGEISDRLGDNDLLIMLSDHGFEKLDYDVYVNYLLREEGLLQFKDGQDISLNNISYGTKAFALDPARIYLNVKGKYPCGTIEPSESEEVLSQLEEILGELKIDNRKVVRDIYRKEQIYSGPCFEKAPDMILVAREGFNLKSKMNSQMLAEKGIFNGKHTQDTAFLVAKGLVDDKIIPDEPKVSDIKSIIEKSKS
ncbi:MAG: alkaline phosphatase family protein [Planctomycetota bacterium]|jgi:predicted AlkP superfamily phosphohydrolase/phosphomutase